MACTKTPITDGACGHLCLCVCKCPTTGKPKCPNLHLYRLNIGLSAGLTVTDPGGSMSDILMSMHDVTSDYFVWKRPRTPTAGTAGHVTIKTVKDLSELEGGCTESDEQGPSGALDVRYISVTTDTDTLIYEWDGTQLCKTSGTGSIASISSVWTVTPAHGASLCCMVRKIVRRIWEQATADADGYNPTIRNSDMTDGSIDACGSAAVKEGSCSCHNTWTRTIGDSAGDTSTFAGLVDGYYLGAAFTADNQYVPPLGPGAGPCEEVLVFPTVCLHDCDPTTNMETGPITATFGPDDSCRTSDPKMLFNKSCPDCLCIRDSTNFLQAHVNYTHLTDCCESGFPQAVQCNDTGEGYLDQACPDIKSYLKCKCNRIPETVSGCDEDFPFPTCPIKYSEWGVSTRGDNPPVCACRGGRIELEE